MKPQCKFETSAKGQSRRSKGLFSSIDRVSAVRAAMATTAPDKTPEKAHFYRVPIEWSGSIAKAIELPGDRQKWREIHRCVLMKQHLQRRLQSAYMFLAFIDLDISNQSFDMTRTNVFSVLYLCRTFFDPHRRFHHAFVCVHSSICSHTSHHWSLRTSYDDGAHKAARSSNASELRAVWQATQGMTRKLLLFLKQKAVWFSCLIVLRLVPVLAGKTQSRWVAVVLAGWRGFKFSLDTLTYDVCASKRSHALGA